jgi:peptidoglycan/xylan/chitin deacetylase (PgdA/CDA1 family)
MPQRKIGVLFHGIGTPGRKLEPGEAPYWISVAQFEHVLDQICAAPQPDRFRISFDDGNLSDHDIALPRLLERGLRADFFVLSGRINTPGSLGESHIRTLQAAGMTIGSHGVAHRDWRSLDAAALRTELLGSRAALEAICGHPVTTAGIPFGRYDAYVLKALRQAGYEAAYSSDRGTMNIHAFLRARTSIRGAMKPSDVAAVLSGKLPPLVRLRRKLGMVFRRFG